MLSWLPVPGIVVKINLAMTPDEWREYLQNRKRVGFFYLSNQVKRGQKEGPLSGAGSFTPS